ncbi:Protein Spindly [Mycoemilia scoparia]|uniref:Protein Spindly n=1 Tax=Mycoemilia scoparia TaxID=417184 RepID=A0A9W7ZYT6_9FUNG|nr:Protein Spindly [Mycoemilia scoparia]
MPETPDSQKLSPIRKHKSPLIATPPEAPKDSDSISTAGSPNSTAYIKAETQQPRYQHQPQGKQENTDQSMQRSQPSTPVRVKLENIKSSPGLLGQTPHSAVNSSVGYASPWTYSTPALQRLDEQTLRERLREAYGLIKEKEYNLIKAATIGQELLKTNLELQESYNSLKHDYEKASAKAKRKRKPGYGTENESEQDNDSSQGGGGGGDDDDDDDYDNSKTGTDDMEAESRRKQMLLMDRRRSIAPLRSRKSMAHMEFPRDKQRAEETSTDVANNGAAGSDDEDEAISKYKAKWHRQYVAPLETQIELLQHQCDQATIERDDIKSECATLSHSLDQSQRHLRDLEKNVTKLQSELDREKQRAEDSETALAHIQAERARQRLRDEMERKNNKKSSHGQYETDLEKAQYEIKSLQDALQQANERQHELIREMRATERQCSGFREQYENIKQEIADQWEPMRTHYAECEEQLEALKESYDTLQDILSETKQRLEEYESSKDNVESANVDEESVRKGTSLLGELDGKRRLAEDQQKKLARENAGLQKAFSRAKNQQNRMRQQVARLSHLAAGSGSEARMKRLEAALGNLEGERETMLRWLEKSDSNTNGAAGSPPFGNIPVPPNGGSGSDESGSSSATLDALRMQFKQAGIEVERVSSELRTVTMLRINDMARMRELERELSSREDQLRKAGAELVGLKYELGELQSKLRKDHHHYRPEISKSPSKSTNNGVTSGGSPISGIPITSAAAITSKPVYRDNSRGSSTSSSNNNNETFATSPTPNSYRGMSIHRAAALKQGHAQELHGHGVVPQPPGERSPSSTEDRNQDDTTRQRAMSLSFMMNSNTESSRTNNTKSNEPGKDENPNEPHVPRYSAAYPSHTSASPSQRMLEDLLGTKSMNREARAKLLQQNMTQASNENMGRSNGSTPSSASDGNSSSQNSKRFKPNTAKIDEIFVSRKRDNGECTTQ